MIKILIILAVLLPTACGAQSMASSYASRDGRIGAIVIACPSQDGSYTAGPCPISKPTTVTYGGPATFAVTTANTAVTVFAAGAVATGCDVVNTGAGVLYLDFTTTAVSGSGTALPLQPGQSFHCPYPPSGPVSAVAATPQSFVAIRY
jgi:hypothetical protein